MAANTGTRRKSHRQRPKNMANVRSGRTQNSASGELSEKGTMAASLTPSLRDSSEFSVLKLYRDPLIPISTVLVDSVVKQESIGDAIPSVLIPDLPRLLEHIAMERVLDARKLVGREIAFLRKTLAMTGRKLAEHLNVAAETVSRWENDKEPISIPAERVLRLQVLSTFALDRASFQDDIRTLLDMKIVAGPSATIEPAAMFFRYVADSSGVGYWEKLVECYDDGTEVQRYANMMNADNSTIPMPKSIAMFIANHVMQSNNDDRLDH